MQKGDIFKVEIHKDRYEIHKDMKDGTFSNITIEAINEQWGIFSLLRAYRSFHDRYYCELQLLIPVEGPEEGRRIVEQYSKRIYGARAGVEIKEYFG